MAAARTAADEALRALLPELKAELARIADWWAHHMVDEAQGGFWGEVAEDGQANPSAPKALVLNGRLLWFFSRLAGHTGNVRHQHLADRAAAYLTAHFQDSVHGGMMWMLSPDGTPVNRRKQAYGQAFALYGLAAHARTTGNHPSRQLALDLFHLLEQHFLDTEDGGYIEARAEDFSPLEDVRLSEKDMNAPKSMNTHLHVLEAYAELYRTAPREDVAMALRHLIDVHLNHLVGPEGHHLRLFFTKDWQNLSQTVSYGHDIEASWLLWDAIETAGTPDQRIMGHEIALSLAERIRIVATCPAGGVINELHFETGSVDRTHVWWGQAEALVGFLNAYSLSREPRFAEAALDVWRFITGHLIDPEGEWRSSAPGEPQGEPYTAGPWKGPYHNGRALIEAIERIGQL